MPSAADRDAIESVLRRTVDVAQENHNEARHALQRAVSEVPSGMPAPDGGVRIHAAASSERYTGRAYQVAMKRLYDFLLDGKIPEDFEASAADPGALK